MLRVVVRIFAQTTLRVARTLESVATSTHNFSQYVTFSSRPASVHSIRLYSQEAAPAVDELTVDYEYVKRKLASNNTFIIDVREPEEIKEYGMIPNSINIPLANVEPVLTNLSEKEFEQLYNRSKPKPDTEIIFYCQIGKRSGKAQQSALTLGFKNAKNYLGSWTDWAKKSL